MKKILLLIAAVIISNSKIFAQAGQVQNVINSTGCEMTIRPFCLMNPLDNNPCTYGWTSWSTGAATIALHPYTGETIGSSGITTGCDPIDIVFYEICWNTINCNDCVFTVHPSIATQITCTGLNLTGTTYLPPCEDCCSNGAAITWDAFTNEIFINCN